MYQESIKHERKEKSVKANAMHKALLAKIDKNHIKKNLKEAHKRAKRDGVYDDKI